jgi:phospholipase D3/4
VDGYPSLANPKMLDFSFETPGYKSSTKEHHLSYLSYAPPELSFDKFQADEQGWLDTIKSVKFGGVVRISTMDWLGQSQYATQTVFWPSLSSAISEVFPFRLNTSILL